MAAKNNGTYTGGYYGTEKAQKKSKFWLVVLITALLFSVVGTVVVKKDKEESELTVYPEPSYEFYANDYSGVFTDQVERFIIKEAKALYRLTGAQVVVVSVPDTQKDSLEQYATSLFNKWGVGDEKKDNGVMLLFTTEDPHVRLEVGKGLEGAIPDAKAGRILDAYAVEAKDAGRWNAAALNTFCAVMQEVYREYGLTPPDTLQTDQKPAETPGKGTTADLAFPETRIVKNEAPESTQYAQAFLTFWRFCIIPYLVLMVLISPWGRRVGLFWWLLDILFSFVGSGGGRGGGGGGGSRGGGGSSGGGGASR